MSNIWAAQWHSKNKLDGETRYIMCSCKLPKLFNTRSLCRQWIENNHGCIKVRKDLRQEPHGWRLPIAVKVKLEVIK